MGLRMATPIKRNGIYYYKVDVPSAFKELAKGSLCSVQVAGERTTIRVGGVFQVSLRTKDIAEAKQRFTAVAVQAAQHYESLSNGPTTLTHKKSLAIAGAIRAVWIDAFDEDPGAVGLWNSVVVHDAAALSGTSNPLAVPTDETIAQDIEARFGPMIDALLLREALRIDAASRSALLSNVVAAMSEVGAPRNERTPQVAR